MRDFLEAWRGLIFVACVVLFMLAVACGVAITVVHFIVKYW